MGMGGMLTGLGSRSRDRSRSRSRSLRTVGTGSLWSSMETMEYVSSKGETFRTAMTQAYATRSHVSEGHYLVL